MLNNSMVCGDCHFCSNSSIVRSRGEKYTIRLENLINSINWVERLAEENGCNQIVYCGDMFDREDLVSEEITALGDIKWSELPHYMLVGNHEMGRSNLEFSSMHFFQSLENFTVVSMPTTYGNCFFLPYITESDRKPLKEYMNGSNASIVFSHNDIAGIQMGKFISTAGFSIEEIQNNCSLFINGHLHNGCKVADGIINIGNLTGQNFSEDASVYSHNVMILDTDTCNYKLIENPYAFNFYKLDNINQISSIKNNAVVTVKTSVEDCDKVKEVLNSDSRIITSRVVVDTSHREVEQCSSDELIGIDHLQRFQEFILSSVGDDEIVQYELQEVCK